ncbi:MAG: aminopeptidase N [Legionella sp.]|nr:MAG: aminopeptidase N [Legionella sp.]
MSTPTIYLKDYQPPNFTVATTSLSFDLYEDHALVHNDMHMQRQHPGELRLFGDELQLEGVWVNDQPLTATQYRLDGSDLVIASLPDDCRLKIATRIFPQNNTELSGLYRSKHMFCTQCEAHGFRRITFFPDRPDVLAIYTVKMTADKTLYPILLSNGNLIDTGSQDDGRHWAIWHDPFPKPAYLFALVAGDLACCEDEFITCSGKSVALRLYVEHGNESLCEHALTSLKHSMRWDEERYGREYDLSVFMIVAVSDFNMGAMENKGLNIFNSKFILACKDTATDDDFAGIESVVAHEYFHNWTGNRVTCRDWFQLSLKEGLTVFRDQEFSRDMNSRDVNRIKDVKTLRNIQFPEDAGSMAHPVRPSSYQEISNFYTATVYNKGAEVIRMQHQLLGEAAFRRGMDLYFGRHDGQAVTIDDFVAAMQDASGIDLTQFKRWYSQAGTPTVTVESHFAMGRLTLTCKQTCPPTPETEHKLPFHIPIQMALFAPNGDEIPLEHALLELREEEQVFYFDGLSAAPFVSLLRDFSAPIILKTSADEAQLLGLLRYETNGFAKWDATQQLVRQIISKTYLGEVQHATLSATNLFQALAAVLEDESLDPALRADLLTPPSFEDLASTHALVDVERLEQARLDFIRALGQALYPKLQHTFETESARADDAVHGEAIGRRKLRLQCLRLLLKANEAAWLDACQTLLHTAPTMTEQLAGLTGLLHSQNDAARQQARDAFYKTWSHDELVLDKWFIAQATADVPGVLNEVRDLLTHPKFNYRNPNRVRALLGSFVQANPRHFHAVDGQGYRFLTEQLLILDPLNPQISARLATPLTRGQRLDPKRQALIQKELQQLAGCSLSKDLSELVQKSLV